MIRIGRFLSRSRTEKRLFFASVILVPVVRMRMRMWLDGRSNDGAAGSDATPEIVEWAVQSVAKRTLYDKPCLTQSLVVSHHLRRAGYDPVIRFGVRKSGEALDAHAWVEVNGEVVSGGRRAPEIYTPLTSLDELTL
jgi:hypothetical protein